MLHSLESLYVNSTDPLNTFSREQAWYFGFYHCKDVIFYPINLTIPSPFLVSEGMPTAVRGMQADAHIIQHSTI